MIINPKAYPIILSLLSPVYKGKSEKLATFELVNT